MNRNFWNSSNSYKLPTIETKLMNHDVTKELPNAIGCKVAYQLFDKNNKLIFDFDYSYSLVKTEKWQILFARLGSMRKMITKE